MASTAHRPFVVIAGKGDSTALVAVLGAGTVGVSASLSAVSDPSCTAVALLAPWSRLAVAAALRAATLGRPVFAFGAFPSPLAAGGLWVRVAGSGLFATAWHWSPSPALTLLA